MTTELLRMALDALESANRFMENGVEFGYIRMPDAGCPDPAHLTPGKVQAARSAIRAHLAQPPSDPACPSCDAPGLLHECIACGHSNYPQAPQAPPDLPDDMDAAAARIERLTATPTSADPTMTRDELVAAAESIGMRFPAPAPAVLPGDLDDLQIDWIVQNSEGKWVEDVFHVEGPALADMLRAAHSLAAAPPPVALTPLSDEQIDEIWDRVFSQDDPNRKLSFRQLITRAIEAAVLAAQKETP